MERDCESELSKLNIEQNACIYHFGASVIHGQRSNILRLRKNYSKLPGKPDIAFTKYKIAIFCDGEFFHGKDWEVLKPKLEKSNNSEYWINKIDRNRKRDHEIDQELLFLGWTVIRFWGKDIKKNLEECVQVVEEIVFEVKMSWDEYEE